MRQQNYYIELRRRRRHDQVLSSPPHFASYWMHHLMRDEESTLLEIKRCLALFDKSKMEQIDVRLKKCRIFCN